jgi:hypothetical protein
MHRSGTSLIADVLEKLGLFIGAFKDGNQEAFYFLDLNRWLFQRTGATWSQVEGFDDLLNHAQIFGDVVDFLRYHGRTPHIIRYLGWFKYIRYRSLHQLPIPWGWKDPRNTFTLPIWREVFPDAQVIHVHRNGVDVAQSLVSRSQQAHGRSVKTLRRWRDIDGKIAYGLFPIKPPFVLHQITLETAFALWETYVARADEHITRLPSDRGLSVSYEAFLHQPLTLCESLCEFLGLDVTHEQILKSTAHIDVGRANAYQHDDELLDFYHTIRSSPYMQKYGYA